MDSRASEVQASKHVNRFEGMSTLRAKEREAQPKSEQATAMDKYLLKYGDSKQTGKEGKPKKRRKVNPVAQSLRIVDMDASGFVDKPIEPVRKKVNLADFMARVDEEGEEDEEDAPVVANVAEAEHLARLAAKRSAQEKSGAALRSWQVVEEDDRTPQPNKTSGAGASRSRRDSPDASPPRRQRHDSPDASPPRRQRHDSPDASPPRRQRHDSPDASPPRRQRQHSPDASPPRRPPQRGATADLLPPRRNAPDASDESPPRRRHGRHEGSPPPRKTEAAAGDQSPPRRDASTNSRLAKDGRKIMSDGSMAGMVSGKQLVAEMALKREAEKKRFAELEAASGSRKAETVYRDKQTGARMSKEDFEDAAKKASEKKKDVYEAPEWGGGVQQIREREQRAQDILSERSKPFARTKDDVDRELNLRDRTRFGDPMAHLVKQKEAAPPPPVISASLAKQMKKSGFVVPQDVPTHSWLKRNIGPPPNRYGIRPGRHWDGVDRSTGFERDAFKAAASRAALEKEARAWAQADM